MLACGHTSKNVDINIKAWENANLSVQACDSHGHRHRSIEHACEHVDPNINTWERKNLSI